MGWIMPFERIDCASSESRSSWKTRRGWRGFASIASMLSVVGDSGAAASGGGVKVGFVGSSAPRPLPSALRELSGLFMVEDFFGELDVALRTLGARVVRKDGFAEARGFRESNTAGDDCLEHFVLEELFQVGCHLAGKARPVVVHCEENTRNLQIVLERRTNPIQGVH